MNKREQSKRWKANHIKGLEALGFKGSQFNRLRQLENIANWRAVQYCNGEIDSDVWEMVKFDIERAIKRLHAGTLPAGFFINGDPRGYALKINSGNEAGMIHHPEYIPAGLHTDWGGYGILAPEF